MDSIGDYIYLLVVIVAAISSIFKNKNKSKAVTPKPKSAESEDFGDVLKEIFGQKKEKMPEVVYSKPKADYKSPFEEIKISSFENKISYENTTDFSKLKAQKEVVKTVTTKSKPIVQVESSDANEYRINNVDDARAAFIAAEIFNRKY